MTFGNKPSFPTVLPGGFILDLAKEYIDNKYILKNVSWELKVDKTF